MLFTHAKPKKLQTIRQGLSEGTPIMGAIVENPHEAAEYCKLGADFLIVSNGQRLPGAPDSSVATLLPFCNANQTVKKRVPDILLAAKDTPVLAGICGTDPFSVCSDMVAEIGALGVDGIVNLPTVGRIDGEFRARLEDYGLGYVREIHCIAAAAETNLLTAAYVFSPEQAKMACDVRADFVIAHCLSPEVEAEDVSLPNNQGFIARTQSITATLPELPADTLLFIQWNHSGSLRLLNYVFSFCAGVAGFVLDVPIAPGSASDEIRRHLYEFRQLRLSTKPSHQSL
jgi:predicted TIM-barrel enzyme